MPYAGLFPCSIRQPAESYVDGAGRQKHAQQAGFFFALQVMLPDTMDALLEVATKKLDLFAGARIVYDAELGTQYVLACHWLCHLCAAVFLGRCGQVPQRVGDRRR